MTQISLVVLVLSLVGRGIDTTHLLIPALNLDTPVFEMRLRPQDDGVVWYISPWERRAGHLEGTPWLGESGNIVIGAHAEMVNGEAGLFSQLSELQIGDIIMLRDGQQVYFYRVTARQITAYDDLSVVTEQANQLTLITCSGNYDPVQGGYPARFVVIAKPLIWDLLFWANHSKFIQSM